jgi:hypothetical protein
MGSNQSLLTIGAMMLLSTLVLRVNNTILATGEVMDQSKFGILATSLASSVIEDASNKAFDQVTDGNSIVDSTLLTLPAALGNEEEDPEDFNDFDDYNGYTKTVTNLPSANFFISCSVSYVNPPDLESDSPVTTWHKKITVTVSSPSSKDTVRLSSIFSYWFFQ